MGAGVLLADDRLLPLLPDSGWDVQGVRDVVGGVMAVCIVLSVAFLIFGVLTMMPGVVSGNMMERAFSWRRMVCALMIPVTVGVASGGLSWSFQGAYGTGGLQPSAPYQTKVGTVDWSGSRSQSLLDLIANGEKVQKTKKEVAKGVEGGLDWVTGADGKGNIAQKGWNFFSGGDGKGNVFQKIGNFFTGADGSGNIFEKIGHAGKSVADFFSGGDGKGNIAVKWWNLVSGADGSGNIVEKVSGAVQGVASGVSDWWRKHFG